MSLFMFSFVGNRGRCVFLKQIKKDNVMGFRNRECKLGKWGREFIKLWYREVQDDSCIVYRDL